MNEIKQTDIHKVQEWVEEDSANIIDIRDPMSFAQGHIPNAKHVDDQNVQDTVQTLDKEKTLVVCCYHGISSQGAAAYFTENGFKEVYSMAGGMEAWHGTYPSERSSD